MIKNNIEYIPIGNLCWSAYTLREKNLRFNAYPFDWTCNCLDSIIKMMKDDFKYILDYNNLKFNQPIKRLLYIEDSDNINKLEYDTNSLLCPVVDTKYNIIYPHDFKYNDNNTSIVINKYKRRCERLLNVLYNKNIDIIFIYDNDPYDIFYKDLYKKENIDIEKINSQDQIKHFKNLLHTKYNRTNYKIISRDEI